MRQPAHRKLLRGGGGEVEREAEVNGCDNSRSDNDNCERKCSSGYIIHQTRLVKNSDSSNRKQSSKHSSSSAQQHAATTHSSNTHNRPRPNNNNNNVSRR